MQWKIGFGYLRKAKRRIAGMYKGKLSGTAGTLEQGAEIVPEPTVAERLAEIRDRLNLGGDDAAVDDLRREYRTLIEAEPAARELYDFARTNESFIESDGVSLLDTLLHGFRQNADLSASAYAVLLTRLLSASRPAEGAEVSRVAQHAFPDNATVTILGFIFYRKLGQSAEVWKFALTDMAAALFEEPGVLAELRQAVSAARRDPALLASLRADLQACEDKERARTLELLTDLLALDDPEAAFAKLTSGDVRPADMPLAVETAQVLAARESHEHAAALGRHFAQAGQGDPRLLSTEAKSLLALGRPAEAEPILVELAGSDRLRSALTAELWLALARARSESLVSAGFQDKVELLRTALQVFPGDGGLSREKFLAEIASGRKRTTFLAVPDQRFDEFARQAELNYRPLSMHVSYYERLLLKLAEMRETAIVPVKDLLQHQGARHTIALRHDIDAKPDAAVSLARLNARYGIASTFYLLHSSPYYGAFNDFLFVRNPKLGGWIDALIVAGCEIGLHNDALGIEARTGVSAVEIMGSEIGWLRSRGARISGTVAHNSFASQDAENFEVFSELVLWDREVRGQTGDVVQLGQLSMASLGLAYEGNFPIRPDQVDEAAVARFSAISEAGPRNSDWMKAYLLDNPYMKRSHGCDIWLVDIDRWVVCDREIGFFNANLKFDELDSYFGLAERASRVLFTLHPDYFYSL